MANYLNSIKPFSLFRSERLKPYFVDKSLMISELQPMVEAGGSYLCITRPRRFGKTLMASMIASYFEKNRESNALFQDLKIVGTEQYEKHLNAYNVIYITFNEVPRNCKTYEQYIGRIETRLTEDLKEKYPECEIHEEDAVWDILNDIYGQTEEGFVFVLDEWDYVFHRDFVTERNKLSYVEFLSNLLKGQPYVSLAYMTGILPIAKYSSGSELNMFLEYTMAAEEKYSEYFGFTEREVDELYSRFLKNQKDPKVTRETLKIWYDGYHTKGGESVYNPRSVVASLTNNNLGNYWTNSGPYDEIFYYIEKNVDAVRDDLALLVSGIPVPANVQEYAATSMNLSTKNEIFSAMVVYGFLNYENGCVRIPNKELMDKFSDVLRKEPSLGYLYRIASKSEQMLKATRCGDIESMAEILKYAHDTESPLLTYNHETDLTAIVNLVYLAARDSYRVKREDKAGIGYADFIFYPVLDRSQDCIILELKVDSTPEEAVEQIKKKRYALAFAPKIGEKPVYTGRILAVGIAYDRQNKTHECMVEVLREEISEKDI